VSRAAYALLCLRALWQLHRYDLVNATLGFQRIHRQVARRRVASRPSQPGLEAIVCEAVSLAACFYWKPSFCLQRSVVTTLLLRKNGIDARLVIGYRPSPFFSHAWVEVDGRVVNDSPTYKERLQILCTA
jgi:hypothetical protein